MPLTAGFADEGEVHIEYPVSGIDRQGTRVLFSSGRAEGSTAASSGRRAQRGG
jgi:hypothetical protein